MPSAYAEKTDQARKEIVNAMSAIGGRQPSNSPRVLTGPERAAVLMLALGDQ